jgi:hypothetical protein
MATKKEKWDGRSRPSNKAYDEGYARIFNPVAKEVRTSKFKSQVIKNKKKEDYFNSKSVKQMMDEHRKWLLKNPTYYRDRQRKIRKGQWKVRYNILTKEQVKKNEL